MYEGNKTQNIASLPVAIFCLNHDSLDLMINMKLSIQNSGQSFNQENQCSGFKPSLFTLLDIDWFPVRVQVNVLPCQHNGIRILWQVLSGIGIANHSTRR